MIIVVVSAPEQLSPSYEELSGLVAGLVARVEALEVENAELKRRLGMSSLNSSTPPSKDSIAARQRARPSVALGNGAPTVSLVGRKGAKDRG